jgi:uncharacterized membrane protein YphA (DoxX/SURF4 family)
MKRVLGSPWPYRIIRSIIGIIFIYAGITKLMDINDFANIILQYGLVPEFFLVPIAIGLPSLEILAGIGLILNIYGSRSAIVFMLMIFIGVLWYGILKDLDIDCGCFTPSEIQSQNSLWHAFYRDLVMLGAMTFLLLSRWFCPSEHTRYAIWPQIKSYYGGR